MRQSQSSTRFPRIHGLLVLGVLAVSASGCSKAPITSPVQGTSGNPAIGPEALVSSPITWNTLASVWVNAGEAKTVSGGRYQIQFVRTSLAQGAQITIMERDPSACDVIVGPSGVAVGRGTVLNMSYAGTSLELMRDQLKLYRRNDSTGSWELVSGTNDLTGRMFGAKISVLGRYQLNTQDPGKAGW